MAVNLSFIGGAGWQFFDDNGTPLAGGKIYTYIAGTTTPLATYTARSGTIPNTNPIVLDAAGRTPEQIWSTEGVLYKYVVTTSDDTLVRTWDNIGGSVVASDLAQSLANTTVNAEGDALIGFRQSNTNGFLSGSVGRTVNSKLQEFINVRDFGAVGDGVTDDTNAFKNAVAAAADAFTRLYVPAGQYVISDTLNLNPNQATPIGATPGLFGVRVVGDNMMATRILFKPAADTSPLFLIVGVPGNNTDQGVENIYVTAYDSSYYRKGIGVELQKACFANLTNVYVERLGDGFNINNTGGAGSFSEFNWLRNCRTVYCERGFVLNVSNGDGSFHGTTFERCVCNIGQTAGDKGLVLLGALGNPLNLYNARVDIAFFGDNVTANQYMIYADYVVYQYNYCDITCENNVSIYVNNGQLGFKGRASSTGTITFSGNGKFIADNVFFPETPTTHPYFTGQVLTPITNNFDMYVPAAANDGVFVSRGGANPAMAAPVPPNGRFIVGNNTGQTSDTFTPWTGLGQNLVLAYSGGLDLGAFTSAGSVYKVININAFHNSDKGGVFPIVDNQVELGISTRRWKEIYAANGTINTSDVREKQDVALLSDAEHRVAVKLKSLVKKYRWKAAVKEKGDAARIHVGLMAQDVKDAFASEGLDPFRYGVLCHNTWPANDSEPAGDRYGLRYDELFAFIIAGL